MNMMKDLCSHQQDENQPLGYLNPLLLEKEHVKSKTVIYKSNNGPEDSLV